MRWSLSTISQLQAINLFLFGGSEDRLPQKNLNNIYARPLGFRSSSVSDAEFELMDQLRERGIEYIHNFKMLNGTFRVRFIDKIFRQALWLVKKKDQIGKTFLVIQLLIKRLVSLMLLVVQKQITIQPL